MHKTLEKLYAGIEEAGTGRSGVVELKALTALSANLYNLVSVAPWLDEEYGTLRELFGRIQVAAAALVCRLERETDPIERVLGVNALFVCSNTVTEYEQKVLDFAEPVIACCEAGDAVEASLFEAETCRLMCNCFSLVGEETLAADAGAIVSRWVSELNADGIWTDIPVGVALVRCEAVSAYADYTGDDRFGAIYSSACERLVGAAKGAEAIFRVMELCMRIGTAADVEQLYDRIARTSSADSDTVSLAYRFAAKALCELNHIDHVPLTE